MIVRLTLHISKRMPVWTKKKKAVWWRFRQWNGKTKEITVSITDPESGIFHKGEDKRCFWWTFGYPSFSEGKRSYKLRFQTIERVFADVKEKYGVKYTLYRGLTGLPWQSETARRAVSPGFYRYLKGMRVKFGTCRYHDFMRGEIVVLSTICLIV